MTRGTLLLTPVLGLVLLSGCPESRERTGDAGMDRTEACVAGPEVCNGVDDDCDGRIDEDACRMCAPEATACGELCVDTRTDEAHCGGCFARCSAGETCRAGACCASTSIPVTDLDVLFVIDNSNSMTEEQASFAEELPRFVTVLATGDLDGDGAVDFTPPRSIHFGVVTTDMGTGGFVVPTCVEPDFGDDGILRTEGNTSLPGCMAAYPRFLEYRSEAGHDVAETAMALSCVAHMGTGGCGFEQQLESMLKAVTPSASPVSFVMGTQGQADRANAGFLRPDAMLAVVILTDEEDCSAADPELFDPSSAVYSGSLNLRCFNYPMAVHPFERYVRYLLAIKSHPSQIFLGVIAGVPVDLAEGGASYDAMLADDRMQEQIDPSDSNRLRPSCNVPGRGLAFPPRRMVRVAQLLDAEGATATVGSICQADYSAVMGRMLDALAMATASVETCR